MPLFQEQSGAGKEVFKRVDDNIQVMEMDMTSNGTEYKSMELKFTRKYRNGTKIKKAAPNGTAFSFEYH